MNNLFKEVSVSTFSLHRYSKRTIALITDLALCVLCTWLAFFLRLEQFILLKNFNFYQALISMIIAIPIFWLFGLYHTSFRYTNLSIILTILFSTFVYGLLYFLVIGIYGIQGVPRSIGILQPMLLFFAIINTRLFVKFLLSSNINSRKSFNKKNVLVYGAGDAGRQLIISIYTYIF